MRPVRLIGANTQSGSDLGREFRFAESHLVQVLRADFELRDHDIKRAQPKFLRDRRWTSWE